MAHPTEPPRPALKPASCVPNSVDTNQMPSAAFDLDYTVCPSLPSMWYFITYQWPSRILWVNKLISNQSKTWCRIMQISNVTAFCITQSRHIITQHNISKLGKKFSRWHFEIFLAHLSKSSGWAIVITLCPSSSVVRHSSSTISLLTL